MARKEQTILSAHQRQVLELIAGEDYFTSRFYLAGGTALAEFYLQHRLSEDLDLFTDKQEVDPIAVSRFFERHTARLDLQKLTTKRIFGLYSFFLHFKDEEVLKVDFNYYPFPRIEKGVKFGDLEIASVYDIAVDKVHTASIQPRARDFVDLYFIIQEKGYNFLDLIKQAKVKFDWDISAMDLGASLLEGAKMTDYPRMLKPIDHREWRHFFEQEARQLKEDIFE